MKIIEPSVFVVNEGSLKEALKEIEYAARISHRSEDDMTETSAANFIKRVVIDRADWSVVEHVYAKVEMVVDRGITHEIVRHRLFSYTQESTRFVNYKKKMPPTFLYPQISVKCSLCLGGNEPIYGRMYTGVECWHHRSVGKNSPADVTCAYDKNWLDAIDMAEQKYKALLEDGWRPQEARSVFPNALSSKILMTGNLRSWRQFFTMRTTIQAHPQMREVTIPLLSKFQELVPVLYDDLTPNSSQMENARKGR